MTQSQDEQKTQPLATSGCVWSIFGTIFGSSNDTQTLHQNNDTNSIQSTTMKRTPTTQDFQLVLDHYNIAQNKNIEQILQKNEPHIVQHRDKVYTEAKENGITAQSSDDVRLKVLMNVIQYIYHNVEPPNEYTKKTDRSHYKEVAVWATTYAKQKGIKAPLTLIYASWTHDIERWIPSIKCQYLPEVVDKYRKQIMHGITSARIATYFLKGAPVSDEECDRIYQLILHHDMPHPQQDIVILDQKLIYGITDDVMWELEILMDADAICFFKYTICIFIEYTAELNKSPDWIWERVTNNVHRLRRPHLRVEAVKCISGLSEDILSKMNVGSKQLDELRTKYGIQRDAKHMDCRSRCLVLSTFSVTVLALVVKQFVDKS